MPKKYYEIDTCRCQSYKTFFPFIKEEAKYGKVFVPEKPFQPGLIFEGEEAIRCSTQIGSSLY
jgi:hypothetical protein